MDKPSHREFNKSEYAWKPDVDYRERLELYRVGRGGQGVLICEPYKGELVPLWRFKTPEIAREGSAAFLASSLLVAASASLPGDELRDDERPKASARLEARAGGDIMTVKFIIKNEGGRPLEIVYGHGRVPTFRTYMTEITPARYHRPGNRAMKPDVLTIPAPRKCSTGRTPWPTPTGQAFCPRTRRSSWPFSSTHRADSKSLCSI